MSQLHPFGRIPAIEDDGFKVFESKAICRYLVAKNGKGSSELLPSQDAKALAVFEQAASVEASYFDPAITQLAYEKMFKRFVNFRVLMRLVSRAKVLAQHDGSRRCRSGDREATRG